MKKTRDFAAAIFVLLALVVVLSAAILSMRDIRRSNHMERANSIDVVMANIANSISISFEAKWVRYRGLTKRIEMLENPSLEELYQSLDNIFVESQLNYKVVDAQGISYLPGGRREYWSDFSGTQPGQERLILRMAQFSQSQEAQLIYVLPLKEPLAIGETELLYGVVTEPMDSFQRNFDAGNFGEGCLSFVIGKNGTLLYESETSSIMPDTYNLFSFIQKNVDFVYGESYSQVRDSIRQGGSATLLVRCNGRSYYMAYFDVGVGDLVSVMLVPEENMGSGNEAYVKMVFLDIAIVFTAVLVLFVVGFLYMWKRAITKQRLAVEAERASNEAKTTFLSSMSHDIRTPMNAIIGMTEVALRHGDDAARMRSSLESIRVSSAHLLTLINDILDISKIESGRMSLNVAEFSIVNLITTQIDLIRPLVQAKNQELRVHTHHFEQEHLLGDELRLNQVTVNLLTNAIKYTPTGGRVDVDFLQEPIFGDPHRLRIICKVQDTGIGMSQDFQKVMYNAFTRATDSRVNEVAGSGLGLRICRQMVDLMGGILECESTLGEGTTFTATVVLERGRPDEDYSLPGLRALLVDHDPISTKALANICSRLGIAADVANSPKELQQLQGPYQVAFVELGAPGNRGLEVLKDIRARFGAELPVVFTDLVDITEYTGLMEAAGVKHTMSKPYFYRRVYEALQRLLGAPEEAAREDRTPEEKSIAGMRVLVAEDNRLNWEILRDLLEMHGVAADRAENGQHCLEILQAASPGVYSAVLMDVRMPVMDGREATRIIRQSETDWLRTIPIVAMTADAFAEDIHECLDAGMNAHLAKPISMNKLLSTLSRIMNNYPPSGGAQVMNRIIIQ